LGAGAIASCASVEGLTTPRSPPETVVVVSLIKEITVPTRLTIPFWGLSLFMLGLAALACSVPGAPASTSTAPPVASPAGQTATNVSTPAAALTAPASDGTAAAAATAPVPEGVNLSGTGTAATPRLAFDAQGTLHLVWFDKSAREAGDIFHRQKAANGDWSKAESLTTDFETLYGDLSLIRDGDGHICAIFAAAKTGTDPASIGLYQRCQTGGPWSPATKLPITQQTGVTLRGYSPARGADGTVHAAYIISAGTINFDDVQLSTPDETALGPSLAIDKAGGYHVSWVDLGTANNAATVQYRFSSDKGKTWQTAQTLSTDNNAPSGGTQLVADDIGNVHLLWGDSDIYYRHWTLTGGWGAPTALAGDQTGPNPTLAVNAQGLASVVWERHDGLPYVVQSTGGAWSPPRVISRLESGEPQIAIDAAGAAHVAWLANQDVFYLVVP
jgi:hypothetical protein